MFSSAFKSLTSNITTNYEVSKQPTAIAGPWTIFDAKKRTTNASVSVFVFKRESLDVSANGFGARASATSIRKVQDEVLERLRKEASSLARLRHPSILQLAEPVEETRSGGLMFATEPVVASLAGALAQKDRNESSTARSGRNRADLDESSSKALQDVELDELEIQKGLLQVAKGLEFLHDSAKLVHGNLTPDAIFINSKSDWKISGLAYAGPPDGAQGHQPIPQISLAEVLYHDPRLPRFVQLNLDYASPDFVLDTNISTSADMFSLGLVLLACYRSPHSSPIETHGNQNTYKKICSSASTVPNPSNNYLCDNKLPQELAQTLPKILARRPAQRLTASEFQQSEYFDNILVNTMRFLDNLPAKSALEKSQFMRGLGRVMPQFPPSVLSKKILSALLEEMKDRELLALILQNIFQIVKVAPSSKSVVSDKVVPRMREIFLTKSKSDDRDTTKEAGLLVILENLQLIAENCSARQFKEDVLPIVLLAMESSTHSLTDAALQALPTLLPLIDFSTVKHDLFPVVAAVFSKTSSLNIKVKGLEALGVLCGVPVNKSTSASDDFTGRVTKENIEKNISNLDKFTMQEKVVPLLKGIKTKEPAVMMAALQVFKQIGHVADIDFLAMEVMPILWSFALGPLLDLPQFQTFMDVLKSLSAKIEREQIRKLQGLSSAKTTEVRSASASTVPFANGTTKVNNSTGTEDDFERLVVGNRNAETKDVFDGALSEGQRLTRNPASYSWSSTTSASQSQSNHRQTSAMTALRPASNSTSRPITPDVAVAAFTPLQPAATSTNNWSSATTQGQASKPMQTLQPSSQWAGVPTQAPISSNKLWPSQHLSSMQSTSSPGFLPTIPPPPTNAHRFNSPQPNYNLGAGTVQVNNPVMVLQPQNKQQASPALQQPQKSGLDKYESLL